MPATQPKQLSLHYCITLLLWGLLLASPLGAGPWLQHQGQGFATAGTTVARASDGSWQHALSAYTEYGWNERVTLGLDLFWNDQSSGHVLTFARVPLTTRRSNFPMALTLSLGGHHRDDWGQMYRISLSAGHGFQGRWGSGWLSGDLTYETSLAPGGPVWKFDGTLGLNREHPISPMIQLEAAKRQDQPLDYKVIPSLRFRIKQQQELVVGLEYKTAAPSELGIRIALWHRF